MKRDKFGIIIQEGPGYEDAGDSAFSTGMMAFANSKEDAFLLTQFIDSDGNVVRHPFDSKWSDHKLTSRDQIIAFFAGMLSPHIRNPGISYDILKSSCLKYAKGWKVNSDVLSFNHKLYLYKLSGQKAPLWLYPMGYLNQALNLLWDCFIKPSHEMNQSVCMNAVYGDGWLRTLNSWHPGLKKNIFDYYGGWRNKNDMGISINFAISIRMAKELKR